MTPAQYKKIGQIQKDLAKIKDDLAQKIEAAYKVMDETHRTTVMECSVEYGAIDAVLNALDAVG